MDSNEIIKTIKTDKAPKAIGPYSQGKIIKANANIVYVSGSIGINPEVIFSLFKLIKLIFLLIFFAE